jgi:hypothetical protein
MSNPSLLPITDPDKALGYFVVCEDRLKFESQRIDSAIGPRRLPGDTEMNLVQLQPLSSSQPQRVAMFGTKEAEMADLACADVGRRDFDDIRSDRRKARA